MLGKHGSNILGEITGFFLANECFIYLLVTLAFNGRIGEESGFYVAILGDVNLFLVFFLVLFFTLFIHLETD